MFSFSSVPDVSIAKQNKKKEHSRMKDGTGNKDAKKRERRKKKEGK